jgi:hypothetical protein
MARIRTVKPDFFRHEGLYDAERKSGLPLRLAFAGLWTAADREGRFNWSPRTLKLDCLPHDEVDFAAVMDALHEHGFIIKYAIDGKEYGAVPSWQQHQHINQREAASHLPAPTSESTCAHVHAHGEGKGKELEGKGRGGTRAPRATRPPAVTDEDFEGFKQAYPKREGSQPWQPAKAAFERAVRNGETVARIIAAARKYAAECDRTKITSTEKVAQALTWLNQKRWTDYLDGTEADLKRRAEADLMMEARGYFWEGPEVGGKWVLKPSEVSHETGPPITIEIPALRRA